MRCCNGFVIARGSAPASVAAGRRCRAAAIHRPGPDRLSGLRDHRRRGSQPRRRRAGAESRSSTPGGARREGAALTISVPAWGRRGTHRGPSVAARRRRRARGGVLGPRRRRGEVDRRLGGHHRLLADVDRRTDDGAVPVRQLTAASPWPGFGGLSSAACSSRDRSACSSRPCSARAWSTPS